MSGAKSQNDLLRIEKMTGNFAFTSPFSVGTPRNSSICSSVSWCSSKSSGVKLKGLKGKFLNLVKTKVLLGYLDIFAIEFCPPETWQDFSERRSFWDGLEYPLRKLLASFVVRPDQRSWCAIIWHKIDDMWGVRYEMTWTRGIVEYRCWEQFVGIWYVMLFVCLRNAVHVARYCKD